MQRIVSIKRVLPTTLWQIRDRFSRFRAPNVIFWLGFLLLNSVLFLPAFLLNADATNFWPATDADNLPSFLFRLFIWRENLDIFRLNLELFMMTAAWLFIARIRKPLVLAICVGLYVWMIFYYAYESAMLYLYSVNPVFYSDYFMARDGLGFLLENARVSTRDLIAGSILFIAILLLLAVGFARILRQVELGELSRMSRHVLATGATAGLVLTLFYQTVLAHPMMVTSSVVFKVVENITSSIHTYHRVAHFGDSQMRNAYNYSRYHLDEKPDIYLIFIESYGSVLYKRPDFRSQYRQLTGRIQQELDAEGWHMSSALSVSPSWGGGSWLAYTSTMFGLHIENHPQYLMLLDKYTLEDERYPHLPAYLQSQGYQFVWLSSLADQLSEAQWNRYRQFYGYDRLIRYSDLDYTGPHYGWGPSPPDQYALSFAHATAIEPADEPTLLFFITQNSHFPWAPMPPLLDDWPAFLDMEDEAEPEPVELIEHEALRARYMESIAYSIEMVAEFILNQGDENAIYLVLGDHQPPRVSRRSDDLDTPLHIISRNAGFTRALAQYGFEPDTLFLRDPTPTVRHEGLYSLLVRHMIEFYGTDTVLLPRYYAKGFLLEDFLDEPLEGEIQVEEHVE